MVERIKATRDGEANGIATVIIIADTHIVLPLAFIEILYL